MLFHIKLIFRDETGECKTDLTEEVLISRYVDPYIYGETIVINGTTIEPSELLRVKICQSKDSINPVIQEIENKDKLDSNPYKMLKPSAKWRAIDELSDVTDNYIDVAPGRKSRKTTVTEISELANNKKVFVVHGHDIELKNDVELFLKSINLEPIVLHRQLDEGLTVIEKFEKHSDVGYAIILLTPDDIGFPVKENDKPEANRLIEYRARQNVIFEFGYFVGKLSRKNVCCIYKEGTQLPSDLNGLIYKPVNVSIEEVGLFIMKELKNAGLNVKYE